MLGISIKKPFDDKEWIFEIKWDGYRALARKTHQLELLSRNGKLFNNRYPEIVDALKKLPGKFVLDGEIIIVDKKGVSHFQLLQNYSETKTGTLVYCIFDILSLEGKDLTHLPLIERKEILRGFLKQYRGKHLHYSDYIEKAGKALFKLAKQQGYEGIIAKKKDSAYVFARSRNWLKIKTKMRQEVVIGGFTEPRGARRYFGALLVGVYKNNRLVYAGHVGGGFNEDLLQSLYRSMAKLSVKKCPFHEEPHPNSPVTWIRPKLVCEVAFAEWTKEGLLRQPVFQGMRTDKPAKNVVREIQ